MQDIRVYKLSKCHVVLAVFVVWVGTAVCQYFDPQMDDKAYLDNIQKMIKVEVNETKMELITQAKIVDNAAKRFVAAQIKENLFIALRVLAERELRELNEYKSQPKISASKKPKQDEGGGGGGGDDDDDGEDGAGGATTRRPNNIIPQVANLVKAVFGGNGNINLTSYVESASKLLPRPIGNQVLGFVKLLAHNPREQWTTTPSTKELTSTAGPTPPPPPTTPQQPFIVVLPASAAGGSDNGAAAINQALSEGLVPVNSNYNLNSISNLQGSNGTSLSNAQNTIVSFEASSSPSIASNQPIANLNNGISLNNLNGQQQQLQLQQQQLQLLQQQQQQQQQQQLIQNLPVDQNQQNNQIQAQQNPIQVNGVGVPVTGTVTSPAIGNQSSTPGPIVPASPTVEDEDDDDDEDQDARQLNGLGFLTTLIGGRRSTARPVPAVPSMNTNATSENNTVSQDNSDIDLRGVAESVRNGLGDLIKVMPDLFKGAREGFRLMQTISQVFGGLGSLAGDIGRE